MTSEIIWKNKKVLVIGLGISGLESAKWLGSRGAEVHVTDMRPLKELNSGYLDQLEDAGIPVYTGTCLEDLPFSPELLVLSPGVPLSNVMVKGAISDGIPVLGELELASRAIKTPIIAITGTNGKTTVTSLIGDILSQGGQKVFVGGNIGTPLISYAMGPQDADYVVAEVSSFQLETVDLFSPFISIILNITPDHIERHGTFDEYKNIKLKIFKNQGKGTHLILNDDDITLSSLEITSGLHVHRYGISPGIRRQGFVDGNSVQVTLDGYQDLLFSLERCRIMGAHNRGNILSAVIASLIVGIEGRFIQRSIDNFPGLPHRIELVAAKDGVSFYDDSKATNIDAAIKAIKTLEPPIILIAGGHHKGSCYDPLAKAADGRVKMGVFIGEAKDMLEDAFSRVAPHIRTCKVQDMEDAVRRSYSYAVEGDNILLSPACSSFDMFDDYTHRARVFVEAVTRMINV